MWLSLLHIAFLSATLTLVHSCSEHTCGEGAQKLTTFLSERKAFVEIKGATVNGNVTFTQDRYGGPVYLKGEITGLSKGLHGFHVHEKGNLTGGCATTGSHYNPDKNTHGGPDDNARHRGDLGNIEANDSGVAEIFITDNLISLFGNYSVIGRAVVVHATRDDYGRGGFNDSLTTGNAGARLGCGVISGA